MPDKIIKKGHSSKFFYILLIFALVLMYMLFEPYLSMILLAFITVVVFNSIYDFWFKIYKGRKAGATISSILSVFLIILIPLILIINLTVNQAGKFITDVKDVVDSRDITIIYLVEKFNETVNKIPFVNYQINQDDVWIKIQQLVTPLGNLALDRAPSIIGSSGNALTQIIVYVTVLAAFFPNRDKIINFIREISPLDDQVDATYIKRIIGMIRSMVKGTIVIAIIQSLTTTFFLWLAGVPYLVFFSVLMVFFGLIPVGVAYVAYPIAIILILIGNWPAGILIFSVVTLIVNNIDNVLRPKLVSKDAELEPALVIISVLGGLKLFGVLGFIYGPVAMIFIVTTIETYMKYYKLK